MNMLPKGIDYIFFVKYIEYSMAKVEKEQRKYVLPSFFYVNKKILKVGR